MKKKFFVPLLLSAIFLFWLLLGEGNFFHWDEWLMFIMAGKPWSQLLLTTYAGHYIPLNLLYYFAMIRVFGLNYVPYQLIVAFLHALNCGLLYLIIFKETKKYWLAILALVVFGFSNVGVENLIWSLGMNYLSASILVNFALFFFLIFESGRKPIFLFLCAISLLFSPLFHNITILMPLVFLIVSLTSPIAKEKKWSIIFAIVQIVLLILSFYFSKGDVFEIHNSLPKIFQMLTFIIVGLVRGNILRFVLPGSHFEQGASVFSKLFLIFVTLGSLILIFVASVRVAYINRKSVTKLLKIFRYLLFMIFIYLAASVARSGINIGQAGISRYAYPSFFFGLIFISLILNELVKNPRMKLVVIACSIFFLTLNLNADIDFNQNFWSKLTGRDRKFISETRMIFQNNSKIADINPKGIWPTLKLSQMWFLFPAEKKLNFVDPTTISMDEQYHDLLTEFQMKGD